jgi:Fe-S-cluster-containing dehydrogenase component
MFGIRIFEEICVGCRSCMVACQQVRGLDASVNPLRIVIEETGQNGEELSLRVSAEACRHCEDAPCVNSCTIGALAQLADGLVVLDEAECINCGNCVEACPYAAIAIDPIRKVAVKCDLCAGRVEVGLKPACVSCCPGKAIYAGRLEPIAESISERRSAYQRARSAGAQTII